MKSVLSQQKVRTFFFIVIFLYSGVTHAQVVNLSDSLYRIFKSKPVFTAYTSSHQSFVTGRSAGIQGVKAGFVFKKQLTVGIGYHWLRGKAFVEEITLGDLPVDARLYLRYVAPFAEYAFYRKGPWEATIPVQIGIGRSFLKTVEDPKDQVFFRNRIVLYEPSMTFEYKILKLIGVGAGVGYRIMLKNNKEIDQQFTSPIYTLKFRIIFDTIYEKYGEEYRKKLFD